MTETSDPLNPMESFHQTPLETFGDYLRRHREASGKSLDSIAQATRISKRFLQAFEDNRSENLPEDAFARGFLKCYAQEVGLDAEETLSKYESFKRSIMPTQIRDLRKLKRSSLPRLSEEEALARKRVALALKIGFLVLVCLGGFASWWMWGRQAPAPQAQSDVEPSTQALPQDEVWTEPSGVASPSAPAASSLLSPTLPSLLMIEASKKTKVILRLDAEPEQTVTLEAGATHTVQVFREVEIKAEDRKSLKFKFDGKPIEISGPTIKLFNRHRFKDR